MTDVQFDRDFGAKLQRDVMPSRGARFEYDYDARAVLFTFVIDSGNIIGPRPATKADAEKHPEAFEAFAGHHAAVPRSFTELRGYLTSCGATVTDELDEFDAAMSARLEEEAQAFAEQIMPDAREPEPPGPPETVVKEKDMSAFAERLEPAPEPRPKRKYTRRTAA